MFKKILVAGSLIGLLLLTGCSEKSDVLAQNPNTESSSSDSNKEQENGWLETQETKQTDTKQSTNDENLANTDRNDGLATTDGDEISTEDLETDILKSGATEVDIYSEGPNADGFNIQTITLAELTPQALLDELVKNRILDEGSEAISFTISETDGVTSLELDLRSERINSLSSYGTSGEYMIMGSLCNTFLSAYNAEKILITIEGNAPSTGHADYSGYQYFYNN